jgi:hypothetical protein
MLTNGQVVRGQVQMEGDRYVVTTASAELRIPRDSVEHVCRSLAEGYQLKRGDALSNGGRAQVRLIQWCLAQGMLDEAEAELQQAEAADRNNPQYDLLRRRIKLAREPARPAAPPAMPVEPAVSDADLDVLVRTLPGPTVEAFSQTVQPLLMKNCAAAGCHGPAARNDFQLIRLSRGVTPTRKVTQRNLQSTLAWIDRDDPAKSRLLTAAAQAHGNSPNNKFEGTEGQVFRNLAQWVHQVARPGEPALPDTVPTSNTTLSQSISDSPSARTPPRAPRNHDARGIAGPMKQTGGPPALRETSRPATPPSNPISESTDPFDPELFNKRFHGTDKDEAAKTAEEP